MARDAHIFTVSGTDFSMPSGFHVQDIRVLLQRYRCVLPFRQSTFNVSDADVERVIERIVALSSTFSRSTAENLAEQSARSSTWPPCLSRDLSLFQQNSSSLASSVAALQAQAAGGRFNMATCHRLFKDDPEFTTLCDLARVGAVVDVDGSFCQSIEPDAPRKSHFRLKSVISKHLSTLHDKGRVVVLPLSVVPESEREKVHVSPLHWTTKADSVEGRLLIDFSNRSVGHSINSVSALTMGKERYGDLFLPTIVDIVDDWVDFVDSNNYKFCDCLLFKDDVSSAFAQFNLCPESSLLLAVIWCGYLVIHTVGLFGWCSAPIVFGVLSRAWLRLLRKRLPNCSINVYVDDSIGLDHKSTAVGSQKVVRKSGNDVFGDKSMDPKKSVPPATEQTVIGWTANVVSETLRPSDKGIDKLLFVFFSFEVTGRVSLHLCQVLASLAQRYALALRGMSCFVQPFNHMLGLFGTKQFALRRLSSAAKFCVLMWRLCALALALDKDCLSVNLRSISSRKPCAQFLVISDAGPLGVGAAVYDASNMSLISYSSFFFAFDSSLPAFQNCREYIGFLFGLVLLAQVRPFPFGSTVAWNSDNVAAISWVLRHISSSPVAQTTLLAVSWLIIKSQWNVVSATHIPGTTMGDIDSLSRGLTHSLPTHLAVNLQTVQHVQHLFRLCDPTVSKSVKDHFDCLTDMHNVLSVVVPVV